MQKKRICAGLLALLILLAALGLSACGRLSFAWTEESTTADPWTPDPNHPQQTHAFSYAKFDDATQARLTEIATGYGATAVQAALLDGNAIATFCCGAANRYTGRAVTDDTKYRAASLSKLAAAMIFMAARDRGLADDETDISVYFGETCRNPRFPDAAITPSMLMTHLASLDDADCFTYRSGLLASGGIYLYTEPGTAYLYSNVGYGVLSCLLEHATNRPFNDLAKEYLFTPLGIDASFIYNELADSSDVGELYGEDGGLSEEALSRITGNGFQRDLTLACGNLIISAKDYVKLLGTMMHGGLSVDGRQILSADSVAAMLRQRFTEGQFGIAYGSQIQSNVIEGHNVYVHTGSAYGMYSAYVFDPVMKKAAVVFSVGEPRYMDPESEVYYLCQDMIREIWGAGKAR